MARENELQASVQRRTAPAPEARSSQASSPKLSTERQQFARVATQSSKLVNVYGSVIQTMGLIYAVVILGVGTWMGHQVDKTGEGFLFGLVVGSLVAFGLAVAGALYRMLANYVLFKTSE